ncbi:MAG: hypothetical protein ACK55I_10125, partial [bacterium]
MAARSRSGLIGLSAPLRRRTEASELMPTIRRSHLLSVKSKRDRCPMWRTSKHPFATPMFRFLRRQASRHSKASSRGSTLSSDESISDLPSCD